MAFWCRSLVFVYLGPMLKAMFICNRPCMIVQQPCNCCFDAAATSDVSRCNCCDVWCAMLDAVIGAECDALIVTPRWLWCDNCDVWIVIRRWNNCPLSPRNRERLHPLLLWSAPALWITLQFADILHIKSILHWTVCWVTQTYPWLQSASCLLCNLWLHSNICLSYHIINGTLSH